MDFVLKNFSTKKDELEISILKYLANTEMLILMFDGVDEVIDYKEQVKQLIKNLINTCQFKMILIHPPNPPPPSPIVCRGIRNSMLIFLLT